MHVRATMIWVFGSKDYVSPVSPCMPYFESFLESGEAKDNKKWMVNLEGWKHCDLYDKFVCRRKEPTPNPYRSRGSSCVRSPQAWLIGPTAGWLAA